MVTILSIQEVADWAKASTKTIHRWNSDNKIRAIQLGNRTYRIPEKAIVDYLRQNGYDYLIPESYARVWGAIPNKHVPEIHLLRICFASPGCIA